MSKTIKVLGQHITVEEVEHVITETEVCFGTYDPIKNVIQIKKGVPLDKYKHILWHELFHCVFGLLGMENECEDERLIDTIACAIVAIQNDNPEKLYTREEKDPYSK